MLPASPVRLAPLRVTASVTRIEYGGEAEKLLAGISPEAIEIPPAFT